jgi:aldose sugar dehydrogenase
MGSLVRLHDDGRVPADNPFVDVPGTLPEIYSYGHRNIQGLALHPQTRAVWLHEHGPRGGDEINLPTPGTNFGWPLVTHGINYSGDPIPEAVGTELDGVEPARYVWQVSPGVSGMAFYTHEAAPAWQGNLFVGALAETELIRLELEGEQVRHEERLLGDLGRRIRDVRQGPEGALYLLTDHGDGEVLRVELISRD